MRGPASTSQGVWQASGVVGRRVRRWDVDVRPPAPRDDGQTDEHGCAGDPPRTAGVDVGGLAEHDEQAGDDSEDAEGGGHGIEGVPAHDQPSGMVVTVTGPGGAAGTVGATSAGGRSPVVTGGTVVTAGAWSPAMAWRSTSSPIGVNRSPPGSNWNSPYDVEMTVTRSRT